MNTTLSPAASARVAPAGPLSSSTLVWLGLMAWLVAVKLIITAFYPQAFADPGQAAFFGWAPLGIFTAAGLAGIWLAGRTGFPGALEATISHRQRFLYPVLLGLAFSAARIGFDMRAAFHVVWHALYIH